MSEPKLPLDYAREAATRFNANRDGHFPGRPLFEGLVANAVRAALRQAAQAVQDAGNEGAAAIVRELAEDDRLQEAAP